MLSAGCALSTVDGLASRWCRLSHVWSYSTLSPSLGYHLGM